MQPFAVIVLAAGGSSRLGQPKQLLPYGGSTLVRHAVETALGALASQVVVVEGAVDLQSSLDGLGVTLVRNENWQEGMGSSIRVGVNAVRPECEAVVLALCDMPLVTSGHLRDLAGRTLNGEAAIVATDNGEVLGPPCAFARSEFDLLRSLEGDSGARALIRHSPSVVAIPFEGARVDVDELDHVQRLVDPNLGSR